MSGSAHDISFRRRHRLCLNKPRADTLLKDKIRIVSLPIGGPDEAERRVFSPKGELAQIVNGTTAVRHLVYWDLDSPRSGQTRGSHYHKSKTEECYVLTGEIEVTAVDQETEERAILTIRGGDRVSIAPGVAHSYRSKGYAQALELLPNPYDSTDTIPFAV